MLDSIFKTDILFCLFAIITAFFVALAMTLLAGKLAAVCGCYDRPDGARKLHKKPVPYFGGLAILLGFVTSAVLFSLLMLRAIPQSVAVMVIGGMSICFVGVIDDMYDMPSLLNIRRCLTKPSFSVYFRFR